MGWLFNTNIKTKQDMIADLIRRQENENGIWETLAHSVRGNVLWSVQEVTSKKTGEVKRYIACDLLKYEKECGWGYKGMDESMGPIYYNVPLKFFKLVPEPCNDCAKEWREKVLAEKKTVKNDWQGIYNQARSENKFVVVFLENCGIPYAKIHFMGNTMCGMYKNQVYRIPRKQICHHVIVQTVLEDSMMEIVSELQAKGNAIRIWKKCAN